MQTYMRMLCIAGFAATLSLSGCGKKEGPAAPESTVVPAAEPAAAAPSPEAAPAATPSPETAPAPEVASASTDAGASDRGKQVYDQACHVCHAAGIAGAPRFADKAAWEPRIAQGMDLLHEHSITGFAGKTGAMPPKGGRLDFSDDDVKAAVDYMVAAAR